MFRLRLHAQIKSHKRSQRTFIIVEQYKTRANYPGRPLSLSEKQTVNLQINDKNSVLLGCRPLNCRGAVLGVCVCGGEGRGRGSENAR